MSSPHKNGLIYLARAYRETFGTSDGYSFAIAKQQMKRIVKEGIKVLPPYKEPKRPNVSRPIITFHD